MATLYEIRLASRPEKVLGRAMTVDGAKKRADDLAAEYGQTVTVAEIHTEHGIIDDTTYTATP